MVDGFSMGQCERAVLDLYCGYIIYSSRNVDCALPSQASSPLGGSVSFLDKGFDDRSSHRQVGGKRKRGHGQGLLQSKDELIAVWCMPSQSISMMLQQVFCVRSP